MRRYGTGQFDLCENAVQDALVAAYEQWPEEGTPADPKAWLLTVARRRLIDQFRSDMRRRQRELEQTQLAHPLAHEPSPVRDDSLEVLKLCCHPALTTSAQVALTLRAVGGLTTAQIAHAYLVPEATVAQRISRAKAKIRETGAVFPSPSDPDDRLEPVLSVLYLMFNEGHTATTGNSLYDTDLTSEAIRLARQVHAELPGHGEAAGLLALMLLTDARRAARVDGNGLMVACCRRRSLRCTPRRQAPIRPTGRRSWCSTSCSRASPTTRSSRSTGPLPRRWCTDRRPGWRSWTTWPAICCPSTTTGCSRSARICRNGPGRRAPPARRTCTRPAGPCPRPNATISSPARADSPDSPLPLCTYRPVGTIGGCGGARRDAADGSPVHRLETGELPGADFEKVFAERLSTHDGTPVQADGLLGRLFAGMRTDPAMFALINDLRTAGIQVGLLSNSWGNTYPDSLLEAFDAVVISGEVGLRKPDPVIYRLVLDQLAVPARRCVFVDDVPVNVTAAKELGMHAIRHRDADETRAALEALIPALTSKDVTT